MVEWLKNIAEYDGDSGGSIPDMIIESITRAARSGSKTVVFYGTEFNPDNDAWDDAIRHIEANIIEERRQAMLATVNRNG